MSSFKDEEEEFWYSTEKRSFSFDNNEVQQPFGVSKNDAEKLWAGITDVNSSAENYSRRSDDSQNSKPLLSVISDKAASRILAANKVATETTHVVVAAAAGENQDASQQVDVTLRRILLGQAYSLEPYKSYASKVGLLDAALECGDGNAILIVILFLTKTLKKSLSQRILAERPLAVDIYVHHMSIRLRTNEIIDILNMLGKSLDSSMKHLHIITKNTRDPERLSQKLDNCYKTQFLGLNGRRETSFLQRYISLLEWQKSMERRNRDKEKKKKMEDEGLERWTRNSSVLECLRYACRDDWKGGQADAPTSSRALSEQHEISPLQYEKCALITRASVGAWEDVERLFPTKGWLGSKRLQTALSIEDILKILHKYRAPPEVLEKFLKHVDDPEKRLRLATNLHGYRTVIDILVARGDRSGLMDYKEKLQPQSEEYFYAESALRLPSVKWKS